MVVRERERERKRESESSALRGELFSGLEAGLETEEILFIPRLLECVCFGISPRLKRSLSGFRLKCSSIILLVPRRDLHIFIFCI